VTTVIWGYFRTGTTLLYKLAEECNPDKVVLYEPDHTKLKSRLEDPNYIEPHQPVKFNPFSSYFKLSEDTRNRIIELHVEDPCPFGMYPRLERYVDYIMSVADVIKVNRWGFLLKDLVKRYNAKIVITMRDIYHVVQSHINVARKTGDDNVFENRSYYEKIRKLLPSVIRSKIDEDNIIDRVTVSYIVTYRKVLSYIPLIQSNVMIVRYEDIEQDRSELEKIERFSDISFMCRDLFVKVNRVIDINVRSRVDYVLSVLDRYLVMGLSF